MKKGLLGTTSMVGVGVIMFATAQAAEAPAWKLSGNANFQMYWVDQDTGNNSWLNKSYVSSVLTGSNSNPKGSRTDQEHAWYFGVDEAELQLNVDGLADNGLNYGFKIEINANTTDNTVVDEVRLQLSGGWGTLQLGDEDGAEDIMNYGGENLMGATGGFDGDQDDYHWPVFLNAYVGRDLTTPSNFFDRITVWRGSTDVSALLFSAAPFYPSIAGDTGDSTKISYFSPRISGFQAGASLTPTPNSGDDFKQDGDWENHYGLGVNYDNSFGGLRVRASVVYSAAAWTDQIDLGPKADADIEDISAWSVGGILDYGPFSIGGNYTDNGESGRKTGSEIRAIGPDVTVFERDSGETSYWNIAGGYSTGPFYLSAGYFVGTREMRYRELAYEHIALTADYSVAPGFGLYAEVNLIEDDLEYKSFSTTSVVLGANVSF